MTSLLKNLPSYDEARAALDRIDARQQAMVDQVIAWSRVNSGSRYLEGLAAMETLILEAFAPLGAEVELIQLADGEAVNEKGEVVTVKNGRTIRLFKRPHANRKVLMTGHTDTVFAKDHAFQEPVWLDENRLSGPGVADMKGGIDPLGDDRLGLQILGVIHLVAGIADPARRVQVHHVRQVDHLHGGFLPKVRAFVGARERGLVSCARMKTPLHPFAQAAP